MKKIFIMAVLCTIASGLKAQNTNPFPSSGSVGIGTTIPGAKLHLIEDGTASGATALKLTNRDSSQTWGLSVDALAVSDKKFMIYNWNTSNQAFVIDPLGKIGIGTPSPASALSNATSLPTDNNGYTVNPLGVSWKVSAPGGLASSNDLYSMSLENYGPYGNGLLIKNSGAGHRYINVVDASNNVQFYLGDGTLYAGGNMRSAGSWVMGQDLAALPVSNAESMISTYHGLLLVGQRGAAFSGPISSIGNSANVAVPVQNPSKLGFLVRGASGQSADILQIQDNTNNALFDISSSGNVGIGATNTNGYKFAVNGDAVANSMTVKLYPWADYVFEKGYSLMPLADLKTYINKNHHLPEIPSAAEVEKNGLNLGEINKLLTKKIEELTLYLIEKDKEIKDLKTNQEEQLKEIKIQLDALSKKMGN
jgi:hypothetical protein